MNHNTPKYNDGVRSRTLLRFVKGAFARLNNFVAYRISTALARRKGARIGANTAIPWKLARQANSNLTVGHNSVIQTSKLDLRSPISIGSYVIIGADVEILTVSHDVDDPEWKAKYYGVEIEDYAWIATRSFILPSCRRIGRAAVCGAGSVVHASVGSREIVGGNPATLIRMRRDYHRELCVESLAGNDLQAYITARSRR